MNPREPLAGRIVFRMHCTPDYRIGLYTTLLNQGVRFSVVSGASSFSGTIADAINGQPWAVRKKNVFLLGRRLLWLEGWANEVKSGDVAILTWNPRIISFWRDLIICRAKRVPVLLWGHAWGRGGPGGVACRFRHWFARRARGVICYTESQLEFTKRMNPGLAAVAAPNACLFRADCGVSGEEATRDAIIYVGRLVVRKKVDLLLEGFAAARAQNPDFHARLVIVGDGPERSNLAERAKALQVAENVSWLGHQTGIAVLRAAYGRAFVSVSPGYAGLSLTQSFALGVPALIARDEPHSPEIEAAQEGVNAHFFRSNDARDLACKLLRAWQDWRGIEQKRRELAAWTGETYSFEKMAERVVELADFVRGLGTSNRRSSMPTSGPAIPAPRER